MKNNGTTLGQHQKSTLKSINGDEAKSPNKTLKLTLKLSKSPPNTASKEDATDVPKQEQKRSVDNDEHEVEQDIAIPPAQKPNPTPTSHGRKPSIFGSSTMEDEQQQEQDDGELSEEEDDTGKTVLGRETGADRNKPVAIEEELTEYSDAEEADTHSMSNSNFPLSDV